MNKAWWERAECLGEDTEMFFTDNLNRDALQLCDKCPVINECLEDALTIEAKTPRERIWGFRAGTTPSDRHRIVERRHREPAR